MKKNTKELTHLEKITYMSICTRLCGYNFKVDTLDLLISLYEHTLVKGEDGNIREIAKIQTEVEQRSKIKNRQELLDKFSEEK